MAKLSLQTIRIASPCTVSWDAMQGTDRVRHCGQCQLDVFNLSEMSVSEAEAFLSERTGRTCVRLYQRSDGTVLTRDCPTGLRAVRRRLALVGAFLAAAISMALGLGLSLWGSSRSEAAGGRSLSEVEPVRSMLDWLDPKPPRVMMGDMECPPPRGAMLPPAEGEE